MPPASVVEMAIGDYWECVLPQGTDSPPLQRIVGETTTLVRQHFISWRFNPDGDDVGGADFACMGFPTGEIRVIVHLIKPQGRPNFYLHSAFPWLAAGPTARLLVVEKHTDHFGLEGFIDTSTNRGPSVSFFDPLFAISKGRYRIGAHHNFSLSGLSLDLKRATG